ncbi:unnamed protein product [Schistocephalus solidus]|uniref:Small nuclear ribonucleoprotein E n=1 Tax=Schistocephalus solidus TaxID=70667 RepID=A0A183TNA0_SCHSO|nr:unnamed protein product [Schistocephalus solidus]
MNRGGGRSHKAIVQPIVRPFSKSRVQVWLYEQCNLRIEGRIVGFDEYMNLVLVEACERHMKSGAKRFIGRILLKGETITVVQKIPQ